MVPVVNRCGRSRSTGMRSRPLFIRNRLRCSYGSPYKDEKDKTSSFLLVPKRLGDATVNLYSLLMTSKFPELSSFPRGKSMLPLKNTHKKKLRLCFSPGLSACNDGMGCLIRGIKFGISCLNHNSIVSGKASFRMIPHILSIYASV